MHEHPRALEVSEELVAEPDALARALDQPGHVGDDELAPVRGLHRPEHRRERRERVFGDLRPGVRDSRQERRLARVRETHERGVGEELEAELDLPLLAGQADLGEARRLPARPREVLVAAPAGAALRHDNARAHLREVGGELLALEDLRPDGNGEHRVVSLRAVRATAAARSAATRTQLLVRPHAREVAPPKVGDEHDVTAVAAVSPIGPAAGHVLLPAKVDRAVAAAAGDCRQSCAIVEHRVLAGGEAGSLERKRSRRRSGGA